MFPIVFSKEFKIKWWIKMMNYFLLNKFLGKIINLCKNSKNVKKKENKLVQLPMRIWTIVEMLFLKKITFK